MERVNILFISSVTVWFQQNLKLTLAQSLPKTYMKYMDVQIWFTQVELVGKPCGARQTGLARAGLGKHLALLNFKMKLWNEGLVKMKEQKTNLHFMNLIQLPLIKTSRLTSFSLTIKKSKILKTSMNTWMWSMLPPNLCFIIWAQEKDHLFGF